MDKIPLGLAQIEETVAFIRSKTALSPQIGITLGSGLSSFTDHMDIDTVIPYTDIPHFCPPSVDGHPGELVLGKIGQNPVAILRGRLHYYEGHPPDQVVFATRVLGRWGVTQLVLTNASGGMGDAMKPGDFMLLRDHINLTGYNPLRGPNLAELGPRFPDMSQTYDSELTDRLEMILQHKGVRYHNGVYCGVAGPTYETPAEVRFLKTIGGHAVGMSTVPEAIAAAHMGLRVIGIACITNMASGLSQLRVTHEEVKETAKLVEHQFVDFLREFVISL